MDSRIFDLDAQQASVSSKIVVGLEKISEAFRVLLWEQAKTTGLSPIQIQILIFVAHHPNNMCNVSYLAKEFNMTKPTISDAIKALHKKELIEKEWSVEDKRAYTIALSSKGKSILTQVQSFPNPLLKSIERLPTKDKSSFLSQLLQLIHQLNKLDVLNVQRNCLACKFHSKVDGKHHCNFIQKTLKESELRVDCKDFSASN